MGFNYRRGTLYWRKSTGAGGSEGDRRAGTTIGTTASATGSPTAVLGKHLRWSRLCGAALDRGVRTSRRRDALPQCPLERHRRGSATGAVSGHDRRVRTCAAPAVAFLESTDPFLNFPLGPSYGRGGKAVGPRELTAGHSRVECGAPQGNAPGDLGSCHQSVRLRLVHTGRYNNTTVRNRANRSFSRSNSRR